MNRDNAMNVVLYTRQGCHLCDDAYQVLYEFGIEPRLIDIDNDSELQKKYDTCVPVVEIDGKVRFRGHVDRMLLSRIISDTK